MKTKLMMAVSAGALLLASPAFAAECADDLMAYNNEIMADNNYRARIDTGMRSQIRQLRNSANILQQAGQEEACQEVVAAIREMVENPERSADKTVTYETWQTTEVERLKGAKSLQEVSGQLRAEDIIGSDIRNYQNEELGEIEDLLIETKEGKTSYAIISHGGFLGLGDKQIAVPLDKLKVTEDNEVFVLKATEEQLEGAPSFERSSQDHFMDETWLQTNKKYFDTVD